MFPVDWSLEFYHDDNIRSPELTSASLMKLMSKYVLSIEGAYLNFRLCLCECQQLALKRAVLSKQMSYKNLGLLSAIE
jgi:hypothetical protein